MVLLLASRANDHRGRIVGVHQGVFGEVPTYDNDSRIGACVNEPDHREHNRRAANSVPAQSILIR